MSVDCLNKRVDAILEALRGRPNLPPDPHGGAKTNHDVDLEVARLVKFTPSFYARKEANTFTSQSALHLSSCASPQA